MIKIELTTEEIKHVDNFLEFIESHKMHFGHDKFDEYNSVSGCKDIYSLVNHKAFVVTMKSKVKEKDGEIFSVTEKAMVVYDLGGYVNWKTYNDARIEFFKGQPQRDIELNNSVTTTNTIVCISAFSTFILGCLTLYYISQQTEITRKEITEQVKEQQEKKQTQQILENLTKQLDSLRHGVLDVRVLKSDSVKIYSPK